MMQLAEFAIDVLASALGREAELDAHQRDILFAVGTRRRSTLNTRIFPSGRCSPHNRWACSGVWLLTRTAGHDVSGHT